MGASNIFMTVRTEDREKAKAAFDKKVREDLHEYGHDQYSGSFGTFHGLEFHPGTFATEEAAENYIMDNQEKWQAAIAVLVKSPEDKTGHFVIGGWAAS